MRDAASASRYTTIVADPPWDHSDGTGWNPGVLDHRGRSRGEPHQKTVLTPRADMAEAKSRPRLLDLFCGAGGAAMGYHRAGFEVVGVDIAPQKHFPFEFIQADANDFPLDGFDAIHASPPCQDHMATPHRKHGSGWMLPHARERLTDNGGPWVIENVPSAPMRPDYKLCGCMFGLPGLRRERWFETSWGGFALVLDHNHTDPTISVVGHGTPSWVREKLGRNPTIHEYRAAMGIDWMNRDELSQAIPPPYTEFIGRELHAEIANRRAVA